MQTHSNWNGNSNDNKMSCEFSGITKGAGSERDEEKLYCYGFHEIRTEFVSSKICAQQDK